ncbi:uncharacterized protein B0H18DRAFT_1120435 [Fomitopsis serialis]|uniref:uncharacterized protein n=1 Tax=Fomitopsis serialis TaxID=139415 RepID=UPI00200749D2|nr:uncharacterized protein B0H18DRAFT_1120435 [Neoantrodia serialis]KAH9923333.1 hypothetical protein B0H18DRAFT_1120435 [Neoantrodia serialis]
MGVLHASQPEHGGKRRTVAAATHEADNTASLGDEYAGRALQQATGDLERDRQAFEETVRRMQRELDERETAVQEREQASQKREAEGKEQTAVMEEQRLELRKREEAVTDLALAVKIGRNEEIIAELEALWQCALCYDVVYAFRKPLVGLLG